MFVNACRAGNARGRLLGGVGQRGAYVFWLCFVWSYTWSQLVPTSTKQQTYSLHENGWSTKYFVRKTRGYSGDKGLVTNYGEGGGYKTGGGGM